MAHSDSGGNHYQCRPRSATASSLRASRSSGSGSSSPCANCERASSSLFTSSPTSSSCRRTPNGNGKTNGHGHSSGSRNSHGLNKHLRPAFILSPLEPLDPPPRLSSSTSASSFGHPPVFPACNLMSTTYANAYGYAEGGDERPRRAVSSPQLVMPPPPGPPPASRMSSSRSRGREREGRRRSDSASSSASLTATEENYARAARRYSNGHGNGGRGYGSTSLNTSMTRFPATYPALWAFGGQAAAVMPLPVAPTNTGDSSEGAATSPSDDAEDSQSDSEEEGDSEDAAQDELIFVSSRASSSTSLSSHHSHSHIRHRRNGHGRRKDSEAGPAAARVVTTARGRPCAGETETELDEMPIRLPTSRNVESRPVVPLLINDILVPCLFQATRFLSIVPATFGTLYNLYLAFHPPPSLENGVKISSIDYVVCALWAVLTGFQCLFLTTGLLSRWKAYYTAPSTLVRLVALQGICWPATHFTLMGFDHRRRPLACWALIGTTTCFSRSVQLWVTSNLYMPVSQSSDRGKKGEWSGFWVMLANLAGLGTGGKVLREEGKLGPRRWDWAEVMVKCALPAGILYFLTAWAMILKGELESWW